MNDSAKCPRCGALLASDLPEGLCPRCLAALPFGPETVFTGQGAAASTPPLPPEEIAPHFPQLEILECLGRGGMGVVYKARQKSLGRLVALKLLAPEREKDPQFAARFSQEAQALAQLDHPHIVTVYDFGQSGGFFYLLMEYVDGVNLRQLLEARKLSPEEALTIVPPLCEALQFAHERGIVHRDIKPENLLLAKDGRVKIADFGIARMLGSEMAREAADEEKAAGTPGYMAPEQRDSPTRADNRADIYSLGVVFYEMLTGELPGERFQRPSRKVGVDVRIDEIVLRALEKEPALRYQTANDVRAAVTSVLESPGAPPPPPVPGMTVEPNPWPRRVLWTLALVIGLPVLMIFVGLLVPYILLGHDRAAVSSLIGWLIAGGVGVVWLVVLIGFVGSWRRQKAGTSKIQQPRSPWVPVVWAIVGMIAIPILLVVLGLAIPAIQRARQHAAARIEEAQSRQAQIESENGRETKATTAPGEGLTVGEWYNFYPKTGGKPLTQFTDSAGWRIAIHAGKLTRVDGGSLEVAYPSDPQKHFEMIMARAKDAAESGERRQEGPAFLEWERSVTDWTTRAMKRAELDRITPVNEVLLPAEKAGGAAEPVP